MIKKNSRIKQTKIVLENLYLIDCVETRESIQKLLVKIIEWRILLLQILQQMEFMRRVRRGMVSNI